MSTQVVILAAGQGKRMFSDLPKVLHLIAGRPMLGHVLDTARAVAPDKKPIVVYGHQGERVRQAFAQSDVTWVLQREQLGTGHALSQALPEIENDANVLVLSGDVPLISVMTLKKLVAATAPNTLGMLTATIPNPTGYGRIKRVTDKVTGIVEEKDASESERAITEINTGIYYVPAKYLKKWLPLLKKANAQGEYYLTDIITQAVKENVIVNTIEPIFLNEISGVNNKMQQAKLERAYHLQYADKLMQTGVTILDPARVDFRGDVKAGSDVTIDVNVIFEGRVVLGNRCVIGPNVILRDVILGDDVEVRANSYIEGAEIGKSAIVGPFARIRPGTVLDSGAHIGNFVEVKNSHVGESSKINHLSYIGDSDIGNRVNVGAGTITCNYDGVNKHKTQIGNDVHIGSDTQLVAPVKVGDGATIGAGSTITKDVPAQSLTLTHRIEQRTVKEWKRPEKLSKTKNQLTGFTMARFQNRSVLEDYIRAIVQPCTPAEWTLAITNPYSPIYKQAMDVMAECAREEWCLEQFVIRMVERNLREEHAERQAIIDAVSHQAEKEALARAAAFERNQVELRKEKLEDQSAALTVEIFGLELLVTKYQESILAANNSLGKTDLVWIESQKKQAKEFIDTFMPDFSVTDAKRKKIENAFQLVSPVRVLEVNPSLIDQMIHQKQPEQSLAEDIMNRFNFVRELNVLANTFGEDEEVFSPANFLKALRENKPRPVPKCTDQDKDVICDAITGVCRRREAGEALIKAEQELSIKREHLNKVQESIGRLYGNQNSVLTG